MKKSEIIIIAVLVLILLTIVVSGTKTFIGEKESDNEQGISEMPVSQMVKVEIVEETIPTEISGKKTIENGDGSYWIFEYDSTSDETLTHLYDRYGESVGCISYAICNQDDMHMPKEHGIQDYYFVYEYDITDRQDTGRITLYRPGGLLDSYIINEFDSEGNVIKTGRYSEDGMIYDFTLN